MQAFIIFHPRGLRCCWIKKKFIFILRQLRVKNKDDEKPTRVDRTRWRCVRGNMVWNGEYMAHRNVVYAAFAINILYIDCIGTLSYSIEKHSALGFRTQWTSRCVLVHQTHAFRSSDPAYLDFYTRKGTQGCVPFRMYACYTCLFRFSYSYPVHLVASGYMHRALYSRAVILILWLLVKELCGIGYMHEGIYWIDIQTSQRVSLSATYRLGPGIFSSQIYPFTPSTPGHTDANFSNRRSLCNRKRMEKGERRRKRERTRAREWRRSEKHEVNEFFVLRMTLLRLYFLPQWSLFFCFLNRAPTDEMRLQISFIFSVREKNSENYIWVPFSKWFKNVHPLLITK